MAGSNLDDRLELAWQAEKTRTQAPDRLELEESVLSSASDILIRLKELAIQAANDTLSGTDRDIIAAEAKNVRDELLSIANTRDVEGNYVFSGSRTETLPFKKDDVKR